MMKKMKDSGIEWCGMIPEHWEVMPNKYVMYKKKELCSKYNGQKILSLTMDGVIVRDLDAGGKMPATFDGYQVVHPNNLLMCLFDYDVTPRCIGLIKDEGLTSPAYSQFIMKNGNSSPYYYYYYLMIDNTKELLHLAKNLRHSFTEEQLGAINAPVPPISEQKKIAEFLDAKIPEVNAIIIKTKESIEQYRKYKQAVITSAIVKGLDDTVQMKDSGIEWIGLVPKHWKYGRIKYNTYIKGRIGWQGLKAEEFIDEGPYLVTGMHFGNNCVLWDECYHISKERFEEAPEIHLQQDDLIMTKDGTIGKVAYIDELPDKATLNSHLLLIRPETELFINKYMMWLLKSNVFVSYYTYHSYGSIMASISQEQFKNFSFFCPDIKEQQEIVEYLNTKCAAIDALIEKKEAFVEEMETYKKSLIYEYVTGKKEVL